MPRVLRLRYRVAGGHVHCRVFLAPALGHTFAKCGDLTFRLDEWDDVRALLRLARVEFIEEGATPA